MALDKIKHSAISMDVRYHILDILNIFNDGDTPCRRCWCVGLACTESGWVSGCVTCFFVVLARESIELGLLVWA